MKILLDTANAETIKEVLPFFPIAGITTNPSILAGSNKDVKDTIIKLRELSSDNISLHVQVTAEKARDMVEQAKALKKIVGNNFYVKIPITQQGLQAIRICKEAGINCTATAIFTPMQALMAALCGADFVAPYVNRLDNINCSGAEVVKQIVELLDAHKLKTQVLAASFKNVQQVYDVAAAGAHAVTITPDLCRELLFHPYTDKSLKDFNTDWKNKFGKHEITDLIE